MNTENIALIQKSIQGDKAAFASLCEHKAKDILYICIKLTGSFQDGQDAAQEVLLAMQRGIKNLKDPRAFPAWLNQIISRTCNMVRVREQRARGQVPIEEIEDVMVEEAIEFLPPAFAEDKEARGMVLAAMGELPMKHQLVLLLFYFEELSHKEIAESLQISPGAARAQLHRAKNALKKRVEKKWGEALPIPAESAFAPTLGIILRREAAQLATEEAAKQLVAASGVAVVAAGATGAAVTGLLAGTGPGIAALVVSTAGLLLGSSALVGGIVFSDSSSSPAQGIPQAPDPQLVASETWQAAEDELYMADVQGQSVLLAVEPSAQSSQNSLYPETQVSSQASSAVREQPPAAPAPNPQTVAGSVIFVTREGETQSTQGLDLSGFEIIALQGGRVVGQATTARSGAYRLEALPAGELSLQIRLPEDCALTLVGEDTLPVAGGQDFQLTDTGPPLASIRYYDADGEEQSSNLAPFQAALLHRDDTPVSLRWRILQAEQVVASGPGGSLPLDELANLAGRLVLEWEIEDLAGNSVTVQRPLIV